MLKSIVLLVCAIAFVSCEISEAEFKRIQNVFDKLTPQNAPKSVGDLVKGDSSHYCCKINIPTLNNQATRLISWNQIMNANERCGYHSCGIFGWSSCTSYCMRYWTVTQYYVETYTYTQLGQCPADQLTCCKDYLYVLGHCLSLDEIAGNLDLVQILQQEGIILPGIAVGK